MAWKVEIPSLNGALVAFVRPSLSEVKEGADFYDGPSYSLIVSHWASINDIAAGEEYQGKRTYSDLKDYLNDQNAPHKKLGEITVNGAQGFEILNQGINTQYAIMFEQPDGIYQLEFTDVAKKENLSDEDKAIIDSFTFE